MRQTPHGSSTLGLLALLALSTVRLAAAQDAEPSCITGNRPAATLLFPYFEVTVDDPQGRTTLISVSNTSQAPVVAQAVMWSTCALPVLDFTLYLPGGAVQSINLRDVIAGGKLPSTLPEGPRPYPGCTDERLRPALSGPEVEDLQARLLGQPDPVDGLCYGVPPEAPGTAIGYLTVDVLNDCSETIRTPLDDGYFEDGGRGVASNDNALWGDFFFVDGDAGAAQGFEAVTIVADAAHFANPRPGTAGIASFYNHDSNRLALNTRFRTRFMSGGGFDGGTELIVWNGVIETLGPQSCAFGCGPRVSNPGFAWTARDERGQRPPDDSGLYLSQLSTFKVKVGSEDLPIDLRFGTLDLQLQYHCGVCSPPTGAIQGWVLPVYTAKGGFSAGLNAARVDDIFCNAGRRSE